MKLINLYGSAGAGKSTAALGLTYFLKLKGYKVEYVPEYAKDIVAEQSYSKLQYQLYIFSKQLKRIQVLADKNLDYIVTDSPLLLAYFYGTKYKTAGPFLKELCLEYLNMYETINYFVSRKVEFDPILRCQTEEESDEDSFIIKQMLIENNISYQEIDSSLNTITLTVEHLVK